MQKRVDSRLILSLSFGQIVLMILSIFAIAFVIAQSLPRVSANYWEGTSSGSTLTTPSGTPGTGVNIDGILKDYDSLSTSDFNLKYPEGKQLYTNVFDGSKSQETFSLLGKQIASGGWAHLAQGVVWGATIAGVVMTLGSLFGLDDGITNALAISAFGGIFAYEAFRAVNPAQSGNFGFLGNDVSSFIGANAGYLAIGVAAAIFVLTYKKEKKEMITFQCLPWEPALGGNKCEDCNKDPFRPCSEYRCKSLGQACELLNKGTTNEQCAWVNKDDVISPSITPRKDVLKPVGLSYSNSNVRPPSLGAKIIASSGSGCLQAFTKLEFGITTSEPAQCKIDYNHTDNFESMKYYFGESNYYSYNHTQVMRLPSPASTDSGEASPLLQNDGTFALYTRCRDANGNENVDEFVFEFCVDKGPDTTPPLIEGFSIPSGSPVRYNVDQVPIEVYVNEPAECKWSTQSKAYEDMENKLTCATQTYEVNAALLYTCSGNVTGVQDQVDNAYYFRCKDNPDKAENERNIMVQSSELILKGSQSLSILGASPNTTIVGSTSSVPVTLSVETNAGANEGKAICYFSTTGLKDSYISMFETNSYLHSQELSLTNGSYKYYFRCVDAGGNAADINTSFEIKVDTLAPRVTRAYRQEGLKIVTDEDAECVYSLTTCNYPFAQGLKMVYSNIDTKYNHFAEWKQNAKYYVKCRDAYGNEPNSNACSIIASATQL